MDFKQFVCMYKPIQTLYVRGCVLVCVCACICMCVYVILCGWAVLVSVSPHAVEVWGSRCESCCRTWSGARPAGLSVSPPQCLSDFRLSPSVMALCWGAPGSHQDYSFSSLPLWNLDSCHRIAGGGVLWHTHLTANMVQYHSVVLYIRLLACRPSVLTTLRVFFWMQNSGVRHSLVIVVYTLIEWLSGCILLCDSHSGGSVKFIFQYKSLNGDRGLTLGLSRSQEMQQICILNLL